MSASLLQNLKLHDPWLPPNTWEQPTRIPQPSSNPNQTTLSVSTHSHFQFQFQYSLLFIFIVINLITFIFRNQVWFVWL